MSGEGASIADQTVAEDKTATADKDVKMEDSLEDTHLDFEDPEDTKEEDFDDALDEEEEEMNEEGKEEERDLMDDLLPGGEKNNFGEDEQENHEDISEDEKDGKEAVSDISDTEDELGPAEQEDEAKADDNLSEVSKKSLASEDGTEPAVSQTDAKPQVKVEVKTEEMEEDNTDKLETDTDKAKRKSKNYDYATKLNYLFRDARFFLVKSNNADNVDIAKSKCVWSTPFNNETKFNSAYTECRNVLLIFSIKESGKFCGLARLSGESTRDGPKVPWILPHGLSAKALGGVFKIDWICRTELSFQKVQHLYNPWNDGKPVKIGRDGQEIEPKVAEELCRLFGLDKAVDMTPILRRSKETARLLRAKEPVKKTGPLGGRLGGRPDNLGRGGRDTRGEFRGRDGGRGRGRGRGRGGPGGREVRGPGGREVRGRDRGRGRGAGPDRGRKRPRIEDGGRRGGPPKLPRFDDRRRGPLYTRRSPPDFPIYESRTPTYADYLRAVAPRGPGRGPEYLHPSDSYLPPAPPRYYDGPQTVYRRRSRSFDRSYDRSVEDFIRRTSRRSRDRSRSRSPRSRSRSRDRSRRYRN